MKSIGITALLVLGAVCAGCRTEEASHSPLEIARALLESAPEAEKPTLAASIVQLEQVKQAPSHQQIALSDLYDSAIADGMLSVDERQLLIALIQEFGSSQPPNRGRP